MFAYALSQGRAVILPSIESFKRETGGMFTFRIVGATGRLSATDESTGEGQ